jgi:hypothetical protein
VLGQERGRAAEFAARREALDQPRGDEDQRCGDADRPVGRQHRDHERAGHHQQDRQRERGLAARAVGVRAEHDRAERAHEERHAEGAEREQQRHGVVAGGKNRREIVTAKKP